MKWTNAMRAEYPRYNLMRQRCHRPNHIAYHNYGGRGIVICDRWLNGDGVRSGFDCYFADMCPRPVGALLDRIDNDGPYSPENCRWATWEEQHANKRNNRRVEAFGRCQTLSQWAREAGVSKECLMRRLNRGWAAERALTTLVKPEHAAAGRKAGRIRQSALRKVAEGMAELRGLR